MKDNLLNISDGKLYKSNDMVRLLCHDCAGCSQCCQDMDKSVVLDPYDVYQLKLATKKDFNQLISAGSIELHVEDGLLLPNLKMVSKSPRLEDNPSCIFLNQEGRCGIHGYRPGICRLFPLGRNFDENGLQYFLLKDACAIDSRQKVKIEKWLGIKNIKTYEAYQIKWHDMKKKVRELVNNADDEAYATAITTGFIKLFYVKEYTDFYLEFEERIASLDF